MGMDTKKRLRKCAAFFLAGALTFGAWNGGALIFKAAPVEITGNEWTTPQAVRVNQLDARAMILPFDDVDSAKANPTLRLAEYNSPNVTLLNGVWQFKWARNPESKPDISGLTTIPADYIDINVPSSWQTNMMHTGWTGATSSAEFDWPIYNNQDYPWRTSGDGVAAFTATAEAAPSTFNPIGTYLRTVDIGEKDADTRYIISFMGVESGFYLYVNGTVVGYDEDTFTPSEFDITDYLKSGENLIGAQVYRWTTGSWLENQDMADFGGIARDVYLTKQPKVSILDYSADTTFVDHDYTAGQLDLTVDVANVTGAAANGYTVSAYLFDPSGDPVESFSGLSGAAVLSGEKAAVQIAGTVANPALWSAEFPNLYTLVMALQKDGATVQTVGKRIGFREFYLDQKGTANSNMRINGENMEFYGVNRHEVHPAGGRHIPYDVIVKDLVLAKQANVNAIRTSHYPPDPHLIELSDEFGLYIMDEAAVESHNGRSMGGTHNSNLIGTATDRDFPGNDARYTNSMVDRMTSMVMRDRNNASVIIFSLGNEAGGDGGQVQGNFDTMIDVIKALDGDERLVHYQGWNANSRVDMNGSMYPAFGNNPDNSNNKPYIAMEYEHMMGNTGGEMQLHTNNFEGRLRYQGGFIWDYIDQAAWTIETGADTSDGVTQDELFLGFDSDWKQTSEDYNFCGNGFISADRQWKPSADAVKQYYQDLKFFQTEEQRAAKEMTIANYNRFKNANYYNIVWTVLEDGIAIESGTLSDTEADLAPDGDQVSGTRKTVTIPYTTPAAKVGAEYFLSIQYKLKNDEVWEKAGYTVGGDQFEMPKSDDSEGSLVYMRDFAPITTDNQADQVTLSGTTAEGKAFSVQFDKASGLMIAYEADGKDLITKAPVGSFFRPETDQNAANVAYGHTAEVYNNWYNQGEDATVNSFTVESGAKMTTVRVDATLRNGSGYVTEYLVYGNGTVVVSAELTPSAAAPSELGEVGMLLKAPAEFDNMTWYGRGPGETYWDRKSNNTVGVWDTSVESLQSPYLRLQEFGNRTDVRWLALRNDSGEGLLTSMTYGTYYTGQPLEAVALRYMPGELSLAQTGGWADKIANGNKHQYQAEMDEDIVLRVLLHQKGVGNYDWSHNPPNAVINKQDTELMRYTYTLRPLFAESDPMTLSKEIIAEKPFVPMITGIALDGVAMADFDQRTKSYDIPIGANQPFPVVSVTALPDVTADITAATAANPTAVVNLALGAEDDAYYINFVRDMNFVTGITLNDTPLSSFNETLRTFPAQWPMNADLPVVAATAQDGITLTVTQPTAENLDAVITATNAFGDTQTYTVNVTIRQDFDTHRPSSWNGSIDIQSLPLGPVKYLGLNGGSHNHAFYYVNTPPVNAAERGDIPFMGIYPNRRITGDGSIPGVGSEGTVGDAVIVDTDTGKKVYSHKNGFGSGGSAIGDSFVGVEPRNNENLAGETLVMYAKFRPVSGSFALSFRDGNNEARSASEVFKVAFVGGGTNPGSLRYSTTTSNGSNGAVGNDAMTTWANGLARDTYYEVWMMDSPNAQGSTGHNAAAYVRYTNAEGKAVTHEIAMRQTTDNATTVNWPVFSLYEGNTSAEVYLEAFDVYTINRDSQLLVAEIAGARAMMKPQAGETKTLQLTARLLHSETDRIPVPFTDDSIEWSIPAAYETGVSIDETGLVTLREDFPGTYFDVVAQSADESAEWDAATVRITVFKVDEITVDTVEVAWGKPAEIGVWVEGTGLGAVSVQISMLGKLVTVVNSDAKFALTAEETAAFTPGVYPVTITANGEDVPIVKQIAVVGKELTMDGQSATAAYCVPASLGGQVIMAAYDAEGRLTDYTVKTLDVEDAVGGYVTGTLEFEAAEGDTVQLYVWDKDFAPAY